MVYLCSDVSKIQEGIGDKLASFLRYIGQFIAGYAVAFIHGWKLTLVITVASPLIILAGAIMSQVSQTGDNNRKTDDDTDELRRK